MREERLADSWGGGGGGHDGGALGRLLLGGGCGAEARDVMESVAET